MLSLFGTAIDNQMLDGKLKISDMLPVCQETKNITQLESDKSCWDIVEDRFFTRHDDLDKLEKDSKATPTQMKYNVEVLISGTTLIHEFGLEMCTDTEESGFSLLLDLLESHPYIGGRSNRGHGKIEFQYNPSPNSF